MAQLFNALKEHLEIAVQLSGRNSTPDKIRLARKLEMVSRRLLHVYLNHPETKWDDLDKTADVWIRENDSVPVTRKSAESIIGKMKPTIHRAK